MEVCARGHADKGIQALCADNVVAGKVIWEVEGEEDTTGEANGVRDLFWEERKVDIGCRGDCPLGRHIAGGMPHRWRNTYGQLMIHGTSSSIVLT